MMVALDMLFRSTSQGKLLSLFIEDIVISSIAGVIDTVLCMPHRGRLNLLTDVLQFSPTVLFHKVKGNNEFPDDLDASGDVLSHLANSVHLEYGGPRPLHVTMLHNPSHLEVL
jgi:probable 2-oxoglutarate dehydrogenase E1 component DHKTD1